MKLTEEQINAVKRNLGSFEWRIENLYVGLNDQGNQFPFKLNWMQKDLLKELHPRNVILKARQLGATTLIALIELDACLFTPNTYCGIIAHNKESSEKIFKSKVQYVYEHIPEKYKAFVPDLKTDRTTEYEFTNGSAIRVGTSLRSGTYQYLHISEYGKVCAQFPEKAREIRTGALPTVPAEGGIIFIESTAEGKTGHFADLCHRAEQLKVSNDELTPLDYKIHFFPWWRKPGNVMPGHFQYSTKQEEYFQNVERDIGRKLTKEQKNWYVKIEADLDDDMMRENPSTFDEAFKGATKGKYYADVLNDIEKLGQIRDIVYQAGSPVHTFWDLGMANPIIWFMQLQQGEPCMIDYFQSENDEHWPMEKLCAMVRDKHYIYGYHLGPHDLSAPEAYQGEGMARRDIALQFGIDFEPQVLRVKNDIHLTRELIPQVKRFLKVLHFDKNRCHAGLQALWNYRAEYVEHHDITREKPVHDWTSHPADALRHGVMGWPGGIEQFAEVSTSNDAFSSMNYSGGEIMAETGVEYV